MTDKVYCKCGCGAYETGRVETADKYRGRAAAARAARSESFERCDTDGFVSQWCHGHTGALENAKAEILEHGGRSVFEGLYEGERRVRAKIIDGHYGPRWLLDSAGEADLVERRGSPFLPVGERSRVLKALGLEERDELRRAWAISAGSGHGLSGLATLSVRVIATDCKWGDDAERMHCPGCGTKPRRFAFSDGERGKLTCKTCHPDPDLGPMGGAS